MSTTIDQRVVQMQFDNKQFESNVATTMTTLDKFKAALNFKGAVQGFDDLNVAARNVRLDNLTESASAIEVKFSAMSVAAIAAINNIVNSAVNAGERIVKALTIDQLSSGFDKYTQKSEAVQTIMNSTGLSIDEVSASLDRLNWFTDETSYNFSDMVSNIAKFTNNKVPLEQAISAIQGVALVAADAGANANEASRAMYNFSQAIATGSVKLIDWKSIENANMATATFKESLLEAAVELKTVKKVGDEYKTALKGTTISVVDFNSALSEGWLTNEVLLKSLGEYSAYADKIYSVSDAFDTCAEAMAATSEVGMELGARAFKAGQQARTFTDAINATKDAVSSGWMRTFEIMFGNYTEAVELWSALTDTLWDIFASGAESRNEIMMQGLSTGWKTLINQEISDAEKYKEELLKVARDHGIAVDEMIEETGSFEKSLQKGWATGNILAEALGNIVYKTQFLSDEELELIGYTRETADSFKDLWESVLDGETSLDELSVSMSRMSGRENIIAAFSNAYQALLSIIEPVKEAFREVFPAMTGERLYEITKAIKDFTEQLILSEDASETLKNVFVAIFKPLKLIFDLLAKGAGFIANVTLGIWKLVDAFLAMFTAGDPIGDLMKSIFGNSAYEKMLKSFETIIESAKNIFIGFRDAVVNAVASFGKTDTSGIDDFAEEVEEKFKPFTIIGRVVSGAFGLIAKAFNAAVPIFSKLASSFGAMVTKFAEGMESLDFSALAKTFNAATFSTIVTAIAIMIKELAESIITLGSAFNGINGIARGIRWTFESISGVLDSMAWDLKAKTLIKVAVAIGLLAAALYAIGKLDPGRIGPALGAITALFVELTVVLKAFTEIMSGKASLALSLASVGMIAMATSILILAAAVRVMSSLSWEELTAGLAGTFALILMLTKAAKTLSQTKGKFMKGATGMILFAAAIRVLVSSVQALGEMKLEELAKGLIGVGVLCTELSLFFSKTDFDGVGVFKGIGIIAIATAIRILASAVKAFGELDLGQLAKGLISVGVVLTELALFLNFTGDAKGVVSTALGLTILGGAMLIFYKAVSNFSTLKWEELAKGLSALGGVLLELTLALNFMPKNIFGIGAGLVVVAASILILTKALTELGQMKIEEVGIGLLALAGSLSIMALALNAVTGTLSGAGAILLLSAALAIFIPVFTMLAKLDFLTVGAGLLYLVGMFGVLAGASVLLQPLTPALLKLAGAIALFGVGVLAVGAGVLALSAGLTALAAGGTAAAAAIVLVFTSLLDLLPYAMEKIAEAIVTFITLFAQQKDGIIMALGMLIGTIAQAIIDYAPVVIEAVIVLLDQLLGKLGEALPTLIDAGFALIEGLILGFRDGIGDIIVAVAELIAAFLQGINDAIPIVIDAAFEFVFQVIDAIGEAFEEYSPLIVEKVVELGGHIIKGLIKGFFSAIGGVGDAIADIGKTILDGFKKVFKIQSPSRVMRDEVGRYIVQGVAEGITKDMSAEEAAKKKAQNIVNAFKTELDKHALDLTTVDLEQQLWENLNPNASATAQTQQAMDTLTKKLQSQAERVKLANAEYLSTLQTFGEESDTTQEAYNKYLQEQITMTNLAKQMAEARQSSYQASKDAVDTYYQLLTSQRKALEEQGFTFEEIDAWAREKSGFTPGQALTRSASDVQSIVNEFLGDLNGQVEVKVESGVTTGTAKGVAASSSAVYSNGVVVGETIANGIKDALQNANFTEDIAKSLVTNDEGFSGAGSGLLSNLTQGMLNAGDDGLNELTALGKEISNAINTGMEDEAEVHSPSKRTYRLGQNLIEGLTNGIDANAGMATEKMRDAMIELLTHSFASSSEAIIEAAESQQSVFYEGGAVLAGQLLDGMVQQVRNGESLVINEIVRLAKQAMQAAQNALNDIGGLFGGSGSGGFASALDSALVRASLAIEASDLSRPTITPVLDMSEVEEGLGTIDAKVSTIKATAASATISAGSAAKEIQNGSKDGGVTNNYTFNQTNNSPKALSRAEIYRESNNLFSQLKGVNA